VKKIGYLFALSISLFVLAGCTTLVSATRDEPIATDPSKRTLGTRIDDSNLATVVGVNLNKTHPDLEAAHIKVDAFNGVVLLSGEAPTEEMRSLAGQTARNVANVRQVHNELAVRPNSSILSRMNDSYLRTRVNFRLAGEEALDDTQIEIVVTDGTVFLMGLVNADQADIAAHEASLIGGVSRVVKAFEYLEN
jgi:osmotically-inducible protein OsmY